jgi:hypothetical protein
MLAAHPPVASTLQMLPVIFVELLDIITTAKLSSMLELPATILGKTL